MRYVAAPGRRDRARFSRDHDRVLAILLTITSLSLKSRHDYDLIAL